MKITIYTVATCKFSAEEKEYLKTKNLPFEEKDVEKDHAALEEMLKVGDNFAGTPVTKIEKDDKTVVVLKGFTKQEFEDALNPAPAKVDEAKPAAASNSMDQLPPAPDAAPTSPQPTDMPPVPPSMQSAAPNPLDSILQDLQSKIPPPSMETPPAPVSPTAPPNIPTEQPPVVTPVPPTPAMPPVAPADPMSPTMPPIPDFPQNQ